MVDTPISGATSATYNLVSGDLGATIYCRVTATNASGSTNAISNVVGPITGALAPANAGGANLPNIADTTPEVTIAVSCTTGTWTGDPTILYSYQWKRGGTNVGTDSSSYTPVVGDIGATLQCVVTATNGAGSSSATSNTTGAVAAAPAGGSTWNPADKYSDANTQLLFTNGNKTAAAHFVTAMSPVGARGTISQSSGKWYFEVTLVNVPDYDGLIGLAAAALPLDGGSAIPGSDNSLGFGFRCYEGNTLVGIVYNTGTNYDFTETGPTVADNMVFGFAVDMTTRTAWFRINGTWMAGDPVAGTGGLAWGATPTALFPLCLMAVTAAPDAAATINTGASAFAHTAPTGFTAWG